MLGDLGLSHFVRMCRSKDDPVALDTGGTRTYGTPVRLLFEMGADCMQVHLSCTDTPILMQRGVSFQHALLKSGPWDA